jgi:crotonobetainyl-CoA:carnitine CoA-transferase CaiB-like acyl-CoA transferase
MIEIAQVEVGAALTAAQVIDYASSGRIAVGEGNRDARFAPQGVYPCARDSRAKGRLDGQWVALSVRDDAEWRSLAEIVGHPAWARDAALDSLAGRRRAHDAIDAGISRWTRRRKPRQVVAQLRGKGIPAATLLTAPLMHDDVQLVARGYYQPLHHPRTGTRLYPGWPMRFSFGPPTQHRRVAPTLGQHNEEVLGDVLGMDRENIERLRLAGVIGDHMGDEAT